MTSRALSTCARGAILAVVAWMAASCADFERGGPAPPAPDIVMGDGGGDGGDANAALSFTADVHPVLISACGGCHRAGGPRPFLLSNDASNDLDRVLALVDLDVPRDSLLLRKAQGLDSHGPGRILAPTSTDYLLIERWISEGGAP